MNKFHFVILLLLVLGTTLIQGKKEEKNAIAKANTNILELIQLFKSLLNQALSKGIERNANFAQLYFLDSSLF